MAIPLNNDTYLDRIFSDEDVAGELNILSLDPDANVRTTDQRYVSDAYNYYLGGGLDASQADFPISAGDITGVQTPDTSGDGTGITASGAGVVAPIAPTVEQTAAMEDIGATTTIKDILDDQYKFEDAKTQHLRPDTIAPTVEQTAAMEDIGAIPYTAPTVEQTAAMEDIGATGTIASLKDVTPEAQGAWEKVKSGLASAGDFIQNYGMATYNFLAGNIGAGFAGILGGPLGLGLTAGLGALQTTPEQKAMMSAAQASGIASPDDPRKDIHGTNIVSALGNYDQSVADSIATIEETARKKGGEDKLAPNLQKKLADYRNYQNEKAWEDVDTDIARDEEITARDAAIDLGIAAADKDEDIVEKATDGNISTEEIRDLAESGDLGQVARTDENISKAVDVLAEQYDQQRGPHEDPTTTSKVNKAKAVIDMPQHLGDVGQGDPTGGGTPMGTSTPAQPGGWSPGAGGGSGGDSGGGGKIVCTMMNDSYGFGSFRNKIWLRQSKNLAPEYQIGYHKIFLPLVKLSKKNIVLKKILEHIAVHRTIDIRQEARGKRHMLGRLYRKILEPICYWVGKNG